MPPVAASERARGESVVEGNASCSSSYFSTEDRICQVGFDSRVHPEAVDFSCVSRVDVPALTLLSIFGFDPPVISRVVVIKKNFDQLSSGR